MTELPSTVGNGRLYFCSGAASGVNWPQQSRMRKRKIAEKCVLEIYKTV